MPTPKSKEQTIVEAVVTQMLTITVANGYQTDIGKLHVEDSRPNWDEADDLPAISVFTGTVTSTEADDEGINVFRMMPVMIKAFLKRLDTPAMTADLARKAISDLMRAIRSNDQWIVSAVKKATFTKEVSHGIEFSGTEFEITGVQVEIEIQYLAQKFNMES